jgi:hypothetical protein
MAEEAKEQSRYQHEEKDQHDDDEYEKSDDGKKKRKNIKAMMTTTVVTPMMMERMMTAGRTMSHMMSTVAVQRKRKDLKSKSQNKVIALRKDLLQWV